MVVVVVVVGQTLIRASNKWYCVKYEATMADRKSLEELCLGITRFKLRARRKFHSMDDTHMVNEYSTGNQTYPVERSRVQETKTRSIPRTSMPTFSDRVQVRIATHQHPGLAVQVC